MAIRHKRPPSKKLQLGKANLGQGQENEAHDLICIYLHLISSNLWFFIRFLVQTQSKGDQLINYPWID